MKLQAETGPDGQHDATSTTVPTTDEASGLLTAAALQAHWQQLLQDLQCQRSRQLAVLKLQAAPPEPAGTVADTALARSQLQLAALLHQQCRQTDIAGHGDGQQLIILAPDSTSDGVLQLAARLQQQAAGALVLHIGLAASDQAPLSLLMQHAGAALAKACHARTAATVVWQPSGLADAGLNQPL